MNTMKLSRVNSNISIRLERLDTELASDFLVAFGFFAFARSLFHPGQPEEIIGKDQGRRLKVNNLKRDFISNIDHFQNIMFFQFFSESSTMDNTDNSIEIVDTVQNELEGVRRFETEKVDDDSFELPTVTEYFIWGHHDPNRMEDALIGFHELEEDDFAGVPVKTFNYNEVASIITLVKNARTEKLLNTNFHTGERKFLDFEGFLKENNLKNDKIAILVQKIPTQIATRKQVLELIYRAKPEIKEAVEDSALVVEECKRQFEYIGSNKRFAGSAIVTMTGNLTATPANSIKTEITYKLVKDAVKKDGKTVWNPVFRLNFNRDQVKESAVFMISKEFELERDNLEKKFERIEADGFERKGKENRQAKSAENRFGKVCMRCRDAGFDNKRHPINICPTKCVTCNTNCNNNQHCKSILRKRVSDSKRAEFAKKRKAFVASVTGFMKYFCENYFFSIFSIFFSKNFHIRKCLNRLPRPPKTKKSYSNYQKSTQHQQNQHNTNLTKLNSSGTLHPVPENPNLTKNQFRSIHSLKVLKRFQVVKNGHTLVGLQSSPNQKKISHIKLNKKLSKQKIIKICSVVFHSYPFVVYHHAFVRLEIMMHSSILLFSNNSSKVYDRG